MRLIDADELVEIVNCTFSKPPFSRKTMLNMIEMARTYEPKKGKWVDVMTEEWCTFDECKCSVCGVVEYFNKGWKKFSYCPNCGARMDG